MKLSMMGSAVLAFALLVTQPAWSQARVEEQVKPAGKHQHAEHQHVNEYTHEDDDAMAFGAHVHGHAIITLVLEGNEMQLAFQSAAQSVVGFEHKPRTAEQRQEVAAAIAVFNQGDWLKFNADANCEQTLAEASTDLTEPQANSGHADFYANYQMLCQRPASLTELQLSIFQLLPTLQNMDVQWVINGRQGASKVALGNSTVRFR